MTLAELQSFLDTIPLHRTQPLHAVAIDGPAGRVTLALPWQPAYANSNGVLHGGVLATLIDTTAACAVYAQIGHVGPSVNLRIDYLKAVFAGTEVTAEGIVRRAGRTLGFVDVEVKDAKGALVALGRANYVTTAPSP